MNKLKQLSNRLKSKLTFGAVSVMTLMPTSVRAQLQDGADTADPSTTANNLVDVFAIIANTLLFLIGAIAVIMLIIGGFRYVISSGDAEQVKSAKNTILYAIIGIVVAFLAYAAVNFVLGQLAPAA